MRFAPVILMLLVAGCDDRAKEWTAWVYRDKSLTTHETMTGFKTFEECQLAAISKLRTIPDPDSGDYECGYMCRWDDSFDNNVCKETRK